ncbi:aldehyde dehydrogenase family protein [Halomonas dongshanensis]|uniref:Aldehyde dehydrogenase family protein n=1 Tax=Halomonas dongshanensis TaxID=2890835 RepID=A0ABT2ECF7_9GAMM|nr:aldehyde dehydrogenase family protein [Halomonas dongshanensis]MCS2609225.1 aldehyde dehydrogenase family protein [Halomonas dongshanensis]
MKDFGCYIEGTWRPAETNEWIDLHDPADQKVLARIARGSAKDIDQAVVSAQVAQQKWATRLPSDRARILYNIAQIIRDKAEELSMIECRDAGKPLVQAKADANAAARFFEYYAGVADKILGNSIPLGPDYVDFTVREPLGVTGQIVPWNYPLQIACRGIAPALATGNAVVLKPAELACLSIFTIADICQEAGLPNGLLNIVPGFGHEAGAALASHPGINLLVFTGSVETGTAVMQTAAKNVTPVLLELGGKSPNIILPDAELDTAIPLIIKAAFPHSGQTCSAGSRVLAHSSIKETVIERLRDSIGQLTLGRGLDDPDLGPVVSASQRQRIEDYIKLGQQEEADVYTGGRFIGDADQSTGHFVKPTLVCPASSSARVAREEIFGPVLTLLPFDTLEDAERLANDTEYGLVAGIWGRDIGRAHWLANRIKAGQVFVNCYGAGGGAEIPFGGYKKSGFGREKGMDAILSYTQIKNVCIRIDASNVNF